MTTSYNPSDVISLEEHGPEFLVPLHSKRGLLDDVARKVVLLKRERGKDLVEKFHPFASYPYPFDPTRYHACAGIGFNPDDPQDVQNVEQWLLGLSIDASESIYLYWKIHDWQRKGCPVLVTTWETFAHGLWNVVWDPFDFVTVTDDTADWAVILGPEPFAIFIKRGGVDPGLPRTDPAYGLGLIHVNSEKSQNM